MKITSIIWLDDIVEKLFTKHKVHPEEVVTVLKRKPQFRFVEKGHRKGENVYAALGNTDAGRYLIVFFVHRKDRAPLILSARDMSRHERKKHGQK